MNNFNQNEFLSRAEDVADEILRHSKFILPTLGRLCLVSTFIEDGIRMWFQWNEQRDYMNASWGCGYFIASLFVLYNLIGQLTASGAILLRKNVPIACGVLFSIVVLQVLAYSIYWDLGFLLKNVSLCGALLLLLVRQESKRIMAGLPQLENENSNYMQLVARILLVLMFSTSIRLEFNFWQILQNIIGSLLMIMVTVGYKTKLSALILVFYLSILNVWHNHWWTVPSYNPARDFLKYDFFQTLSVIGGLLMVVSLGPGGVSLDESHKKRW